MGLGEKYRFVLCNSLKHSGCGVKSRDRHGFFISVDAQKTGTGNAVVAAPVPAFCVGSISEKTVPVPVFHRFKQKPAMFE